MFLSFTSNLNFSIFADSAVRWIVATLTFFYSSFIGSVFLPRGIAAFTLKQLNNSSFRNIITKIQEAIKKIQRYSLSIILLDRNNTLCKN